MVIISLLIAMMVNDNGFAYDDDVKEIMMIMILFMTMVMFLKGVNHFANRLSYNAYDYDDAYSNTFFI